jgi:hypothetical protein
MEERLFRAEVRRSPDEEGKLLVRDFLLLALTFAQVVAHRAESPLTNSIPASPKQLTS